MANLPIHDTYTSDIASLYFVYFYMLNNREWRPVVSLIFNESFENCNLFFLVSLRNEMSRKLHLICMKTESFQAKIRCYLNDISYLSETQNNNFQFL